MRIIATWTERYDVDRPDYPTQDQMITGGTTPISTAPEATTLVVSRTGAASASLESPVACGDTPPTDEALTNTPSASSPDAALAEFLNTDQARTLYKLGYEQLTVADTDTNRYERRNEVGDLVTVVEISASDDGWRATRLQASPC